MSANKSWLALLVILLLACSGCVRETTEGSTHEFTYELWVAVVAALVGVAVAVGGFLFRAGRGWRGWILAAAGVMVALFMGPSLAMSRIAVNDKGFLRSSGIFGMTSVQDVKFSDIRSIKLETRRGRRGRRTDYMVCTKRDGSTAEFGMGDALEQSAAPLILRGAATSGIQIVDQTEQ